MGSDFPNLEVVMNLGESRKIVDSLELYLGVDIHKSQTHMSTLHSNYAGWCMGMLGCMDYCHLIETRALGHSFGLFTRLA